MAGEHAVGWGSLSVECKVSKAWNIRLASQLQRSAVSLPSNIAEGHGRNSRKEFQHFLGIALGSLAELETQVILAQQFGYLTETEIDPALRNADEVGKMLKGLQKSLASN